MPRKVRSYDAHVSARRVLALRFEEEANRQFRHVRHLSHRACLAKATYVIQLCRRVTHPKVASRPTTIPHRFAQLCISAGAHDERDDVVTAITSDGANHHLSQLN